MKSVLALTYLLTWPTGAAATCSGLGIGPARPEVLNHAELLTTEPLNPELLKRANVDVGDLTRNPHLTVSLESLRKVIFNRESSLPIDAWTEFALLMHGRPGPVDRNLKKTLPKQNVRLLTLRVPVRSRTQLPIAAMRIGSQHYSLQMLSARSYDRPHPRLESIYSVQSTGKTPPDADRKSAALPGAWANRGVFRAHLVAEYDGGNQEILMSREELQPVVELDGTFAFKGDFLVLRLLVSTEQLDLFIRREPI